MRRVRVFSSKKYGVVCIKNSTDRLVTYQTRWGNSRRGNIVSLGSGDSWWHAFTNKQVEPGRYQRSPSLKIKFTAGYGGARNNKPSRRSYRLNPRGTNSQRCDEGHLYEFKKRGKYIDLYGIRRWRLRRQRQEHLQRTKRNDSEKIER